MVLNEFNVDDCASPFKNAKDWWTSLQRSFSSTVCALLIASCSVSNLSAARAVQISLWSLSLDNEIAASFVGLGLSYSSRIRRHSENSCMLSLLLCSLFFIFITCR